MEESVRYLKEQFELPEVDIRTYSPQVLAYIGDGVYELVIRTILVSRETVRRTPFTRRPAGM